MFRFQLFIYSIIAVLFVGCQRAPVKRTYHEIVQSTPSQPARPMAPTSGEARPKGGAKGDQVRGAATMPAIPDDEIHAFLRQKEGGLPVMPMTGAVDPQTLKMLESSVTRPPLSWVTPQGWQETPGGGMRLVSFVSTDKDNPVECAIISLGGQAGGLESNAARWMQQVNIAAPDAPAMEQFLAAQKKIKTKDGFDATIIDLTLLQSKDDSQSPSMAATIITLPEMTVFVKMTGSRGAVLKNKEKFEALCESLKLD